MAARVKIETVIFGQKWPKMAIVHLSNEQVQRQQLLDLGLQGIVLMKHIFYVAFDLLKLTI